MTQGQELPAGWETARLGEILPLSYGKGLTAQKRNETGSFPVYGSSGVVGFHNEQVTSKPSLIVGRKGSSGKVFYSERNCWPIDTVYFVEEQAHLELKYFYYLLSHIGLDKLDNSTAIPSLNRDVYNQIEVPVAPFFEQQRIVSKIEELFSDLDAGEASLRKVQKLLATYRQAVLKAAVTGELTKDWREANRHRLESGEALLQRILKARREQWKGRGQYQELHEPNLTHLPRLPEGWHAATVDQLSSEVEYGSSAKCASNPTGVPVLRMGNIVQGKLVTDDLKYLPESHEEFPKLLLRKGDMLFNRTNSAELVGKTAVYDGRPGKASFASYLIRVRLIVAEPHFVSAFMNSAFGRSWVKRVVSQQVGQANVNGSKLKALTLPLPSEEEQVEISNRLDGIFSQIDTLETWCSTELKRSSTLRQAILKAAFSGKLVPQDPSDEPASVLLARIRAEREEQSVGNRRGRPSKAAPALAPSAVAEAHAGRRPRGRPRKHVPTEEPNQQKTLW